MTKGAGSGGRTGRGRAAAKAPVMRRLFGGYAGVSAETKAIAEGILGTNAASALDRAYQYKFNGYEAEITRLDGIRNTLIVSGAITDKNGDRIATFRRELIGGSQKTVYHASFFVDEAHQGKGLGKRLLRNSFREYERAGFKSVSVTPVDAGRYVWPRMGFTWDSKWDKYNNDSLVRALMTEGIPRSKAHGIARSTENKAWKVAALRIGGKHFGKEYLKSGSATLLGMSLPLGSEGWAHAKRYLRF